MNIAVITKHIHFKNKSGEQITYGFFYVSPKITDSNENYVQKLIIVVFVLNKIRTV